MCVTFLHSPDLCYFFGINLIFVTFLHSPDFIIDSAIWEDLKGGHLVQDLRLAAMSEVCQLEIIGLDRIGYIQYIRLLDWRQWLINNHLTSLLFNLTRSFQNSNKNYRWYNLNIIWIDKWKCFAIIFGRRRSNDTTWKWQGCGWKRK